MPKFRKRPVIVEAEQYLPGRQRTDPSGLHPASVQEEALRPYVITARGERVYVDPGDWIIAEPDGCGFYRCEDHTFRATYESVALHPDQMRGSGTADTPGVGRPDRSVEGVVNSICFTPGRGDGLLSLELQQPEDRPMGPVMLFTKDEAHDITVDGDKHIGHTEPVSGWLLPYLFGTRCSVKVWLRPDHYGSAVRAEFTTLAPEAPCATT